MFSFYEEGIVFAKEIKGANREGVGKLLHIIATLYQSQKNRFSDFENQAK